MNDTEDLNTEADHLDEAMAAAGVNTAAELATWVKAQLARMTPDRTPFEDVDVRSLSHRPEAIAVEVCSVCGLRWLAHLHMAFQLYYDARVPQDNATAATANELRDEFFAQEQPVDVRTCVLLQGDLLNPNKSHR